MYSIEKYTKYLINTYNPEQVIYLLRQIDNMQSDSDNKQSTIAWDIVNKISDRKSVKKAKLKANT